MNRSLCTRFKSSLFGSAILASLLTTAAIQAATIRVPQDQPTIQLGIQAANPSDTVLVGPGVYFEKIHFTGRPVTLKSEQGPELTIIDGSNNSGSVVTFELGESQTSILSGFTIQNGTGPFGGGIFIRFASPKIENNIIRDNEAHAGGGILLVGSGALIEGNEIVENRIVGSTTPGGAGIRVDNANGAIISRNNISRNNNDRNTSPITFGGGGVHISGASRVTIRDNIVSENGASFGGGIFIENSLDALIVQNVIYRNFANGGPGGGIAWSLPAGSQLINNTISDNSAFLGSGVFLGGTTIVNNALIANNNIVGKETQSAVDCLNSTNSSGASFRFNNVFSPQGLPYGFGCGIVLPFKGSISADPLFVDPIGGDFRLRPGSPSIDLGGNEVPNLPNTDFGGSPRILDGNDDGVAVVDIGAYEYSTIPVANAGPDQTIACGADCMATVNLDGSNSSDPNGDQLTYTWTGTFGTASSATPSVLLPKGEHTITLVVSDPAGNTSSDEVMITVVDTTPPSINSLVASPNVLLQANHQMVPVSVTVSVSDNCDPSVACRIISVTSNEPVNGLGDGDTAPDWEITGNLTVNIRAERSAHGTGRVYTITIECTDLSGNKSTRTVPVNVPRNN